MNSLLEDNDINNDVKLDTLNEGLHDEASPSLLSGNIILPKDCFSSYVAYLIYEMAHFKLTAFVIVLSAIVLSLILLLWDFIERKPLNIVLIANFIVFDTFGIIAAVIKFAMPMTGDNFQTKLLMEVIARKPSVEGVEWRTIAYNVNEYLFNKGLWNTPYSFYSEDSCYGTFKRFMKGKNPNAIRKYSASNSTNPQSGTTIENGSNDATTFHRFSSDPILEGYFVKAAEIQKEALREYWGKQYPDTDIP
ncbi:YAR028W-like protein [Saccharomyces cerevisiae x Saccharomyces kudriavzevii VIN7]|uniref:YAR028W-like protein n=1 Tax=Saccharomyces cerevisiae x Saccharomyces kudriavzevii (strain VIN7) TaxID=1095631 RepID=H0GZB4_SACCK|nr:YAR028W-like protein [Saccharomyces cerevisiae x Saccharomyces kudriavzevii VIN7]